MPNSDHSGIERLGGDFIQRELELAQRLVDEPRAEFEWLPGGAAP
jgi:hypothetical protein